MKQWWWALPLLASACGSPAVPPDAQTTPEVLAAGARAYQANGCRVCHGPEGRGDGPLADSLNPRPRDFTDASAFLEDRSITAIAAVIAEGVPSRPTPMPPFSHLDETTRYQMAAWILSRAATGPDVNPKEP